MRFSPIHDVAACRAQRWALRLTGVAGRLCGETSRFSLELLILTLLQLMGPMLVALLRLLFLLTELSGDVLAGLLPIDVA